jgi:hypothetical protein
VDRRSGGCVTRSLSCVSRRWSTDEVSRWFLQKVPQTWLPWEFVVFLCDTGNLTCILVGLYLQMSTRTCMWNMWSWDSLLMSVMSWSGDVDTLKSWPSWVWRWNSYVLSSSFRHVSRPKDFFFFPFLFKTPKSRPPLSMSSEVSVGIKSVNNGNYRSWHFLFRRGDQHQNRDPTSNCHKIYYWFDVIYTNNSKPGGNSKS